MDNPHLASSSTLDDDVDRSSPSDRAWVAWAVSVVEAEARRTADTHLLKLPMPADWDVDVYLKDESTHTSGSLKHRLARSLFLFALCNGWLCEGSTVVEASSGSTAISEAYFARLLGLPFVAVVPRGTSPEKLRLIEQQGGRCHLVEHAGEVYDEARRVALSTGGHYLDQFTYAERATDWRGNNNIAESIFAQMSLEPHPVPAWVVLGAGTGGTSATIGRYLRYRGFPTGVCVVDPEGSAFFDGWQRADLSFETGRGSRVEGIGRPRMEPSFVPTVVDRMMRVPDAASVAGARVLLELTGRRAGASTGTNLYGALKLACEMRASGVAGSVVTLLCDEGGRYADSYFDDDWVAGQGLDLAPWLSSFRRAVEEGTWAD
ncbi:MAG TPA: PLP-dependent cysteine synthase family protein [Marmoricola sp.]|nr:PLP-dependent cysteine synthase family protein [Marmoricola sp.]